jgi:predicted RNA-binding Zn-ribbon protein involved in translation (DUF1610 family)
MNQVEKDKVKTKPRTRGTKFCPRCGSTNIFWAKGLAQLWSIWECKNCGYYGAFIVEDGKLSQKLQEEYVKKLQDKTRLSKNTSADTA